MKERTLNIIAVIVLALTLILGVLMLIVYTNPTSGINPFPPPPTPGLLQLPTATPTLKQLPPTWTATAVPEFLVQTSTLRPSSTPVPTMTDYEFSSRTPTATDTSTPTSTPTRTHTPRPTATRTVTPTFTLAPTNTTEPTLTSTP